MRIVCGGTILHNEKLALGLSHERVLELETGDLAILLPAVIVAGTAPLIINIAAVVHLLLVGRLTLHS